MRLHGTHRAIRIPPDGLAKPRRGRAQRGFTLVELMVAMTLTMILVMVAMQISVIVLTGYKRHRDAVAVQRAARGSLDLVTSAVRNASAAVPNGRLQDAAACTDMEVIRVVDHTDAPDELYAISASGGVVTSLRAPLADGDTTATVLDGTGLVPGDLIIIADIDAGHVLRVTSATNTGSGWTIGLEAGGCAGVSYAHAAGALVLRARVNHFFVDDVGGVPTMFLDDDGDGPDTPEPLAEGVEDFQVAVGVDVDRDGAVTDAEWFYAAAGSADPPAIATVGWRALRLTVVARSIREDVGAGWSARPPAEDHAGGDVDGYRRRAASTIVEIRNLGGAT